MSENSYVMIHAGEEGTEGHPEIKKRWDAKLLRDNQWMEDLYLEKIKNKKPKFPRAKLAEMLKFDTILEAKEAIENGVDDLDYVVDYEAFKRGEIDAVKEQVLEGTKLGLANHKIVKWIIEVAALDNHQIVQLSALIKNVVIANFDENCYEKVFVKSSTGFYKTPEGVPNGATVPTIKLMLENSCPLLVKAAGGVRTYEEAVEMIQLGVKRIGTSAAKAITNGEISNSNY
jgi:deoxyribose-phosphate aldolase